MKHDDLDEVNDAFKIWVTPNSFVSNSQQVRNRWNLAVTSTLDVNCSGDVGGLAREQVQHIQNKTFII
jgi:hypothetical protein